MRNSQVLVPRRRFGEFARRALASPKVDMPIPFSRSPSALVVSPAGQHAVLLSADGFELLDEKGNVSQILDRSEDVMAFDEFALVAGKSFTWAATEGANEAPPGSMLVRRMDRERFAAIGVGSPALYDLGPQPPNTTIEGGLRVPDPRWRFSKTMKGKAVAAIAADFTAFVARDNRKLQVFAARRDSKGEAILEAEHDAGMVARWISLTDAHVVLLAAEGTATRLRAFTLKAAPVYTLTVPFEVLQPAIAGAGKRIYLAGKGLAAIDDGKLTWSHPSEEPLYVSSFEDGTLAVARGKRLEFVKTDGSIDQSFDTEEPLVAPPAIAGDGSVWAASATALYIAR